MKILLLLSTLLLFGPPLFSQSPVPAPDRTPDLTIPEGTKLTVLTLNLHTWQEKGPREKLARIADFMASTGVDLAAFQECGQHRDGTPAEPLPSAPLQTTEDPLFRDQPGLPGNAALLIQNRLKEVHQLDYFLVWNWAHIGFGSYQEGAAILSRFPLRARGEAVVSTDQEIESPSRRKILWADLEVPGVGPFRIVSAHLGWGGDQIAQIRNTEAALAALPPRPTLVAGDFNMAPRLPGYLVLTEEFQWRDDWKGAAVRLTTGLTMGADRIDYLWSRKPTLLSPLKSTTVFRPRDTGSLAPVSDHAGVLVWYGPL